MVLQNVFYPSSYMTEENAKHKIFPANVIGVSDVKPIVIPSELRNTAISPHYAVGIDDNKKLVFGLLDICEDQQGCGSVAYGDIIAPASYTENNTTINIKWILAVVEVSYNGDWRREVWELDENGNVVRRFNGPVLLEITDTNGNTAYIPIGNPLAALGAPALLYGAAIIGGSIAAYKLFDWLKEREKRKMIEDITKAGEKNPEIVRLVLHPVAGESVDASNGGLMSKLKDFIVGFGTIGALIVMVLKWQVILEFFRSLRDMFRRR